MKNIPKIVLGFFIALMGAVFAVIVFSPECSAFESIIDGADSARGDSQPVDLFGSNGVFTKISGTLLFATGAASVFMLIVGGVRFVISGGNASAVSGAKNTIFYAVVGIVVSITAYGAVNFVLSALLSGGSENI